MFETAASPDSTHLVWLFFFAACIVGTTFILRQVHRTGYAWWARLLFVILCVFAGHAIQAVTPLRGMPGIPALLLFPLVPDGLSNDYYMHFRSTGMDMREANDLGRVWGYKHAFAIWTIVAAMAFLWVWLRPTANRILHGDDEPTIG